MIENRVFAPTRFQSPLGGSLAVFGKNTRQNPFIKVHKGMRPEVSSWA